MDNDANVTKRDSTKVIELFYAAVRASIEDRNLVLITLSKPTLHAIDLKSVDVRMIEIKREIKLSFTYHHARRDIVKNYTIDEAMSIVAQMMVQQFMSAKCYTLTADMHLKKTSDGFDLQTLPPSKKAVLDLSHDKAKKRLLRSEGKGYLHALGITDAKGNVLNSAQDKYRQINKYIEILDGLITSLPVQNSYRIIDMGSGKGYLTFALYDHLVNTLGREAEVIGIEARAELVTLCNRIARESGYEGLRFIESTIEAFDCAGADVVIALHACDTASDDAIAKAVKAEAKLIVVAPCCHKQIRRAMADTAGGDALAFLMVHGTYKERMAEMVTDGMRAQMMELHGYRTKLFEFISDAHTPKNVMIVAQKHSQIMSDKQRAKIVDSLAYTKKQFGISHHQLEQLLANK